MLHVSKHNPGEDPEWIQRMTLRVEIKVACAEVANDLGPLSYMHRFAAAIKATSVAVAAERYSRVDPPEYTNLLSDHVIELVGEFDALPVSCNPPWREGELSF